MPSLVNGRGAPTVVTCWSVDVDDPEAARRCMPLLPPAERRRVTAFLPPHRHRRACAQAAARILAAAELGAGAGLDCLTRTDDGRLVLARSAGAGDAPLDLSLSYSGGSAVIALSRCGTVGVDIEAVEALGAAEEQRLASFSLAPSEYAQWHAAAPGLRARLLARAWTRKEAVLKALGLGLTGDVRAVATRLTPAAAHEAVAVDALPDTAGDIGLWTVHDLPDGPDHVGTIAVHAANARVRHHECNIWELLEQRKGGGIGEST